MEKGKEGMSRTESVWEGSFLYAIAFCSHPIIQQPDLPDRCANINSHTLTLLHTNAMAPKLTDGTNTLTPSLYTYLYSHL